MSSFAHAKFLWLEQVGRDRKASTRLAVALVKYFNERNGGCAWPSIARLADDTCMSERTVQRDLAGLVAQGHLQRMAGGGRHRTNKYRMVLNEKAVHCETGSGTVTSASGNGDISGKKPRQTRHPIPADNKILDSVNHRKRCCQATALSSGARM
jgi:predicted DNA-binding transcriptional regulator YafY